MLVKNLGQQLEQWGNYDLLPGEWCYLPDKIAHNAKLLDNPAFECVDFSNGDYKTDVVILSGCPMGTTGGGQHPAQIARELAQQGCRVLYVTSGKPDGDQKNLYVIREKNLFSSKPASSTDIRKWADILKGLRSPNKIALLTFPSSWVYEIGGIAWLQEYQLAYWCLDDWAEINKAQQSDYYSAIIEQKIVELCHQPIATAGILARKLQAFTKREIPVIGNGFSRKNFPEKQAVNMPVDMLQGEKTLVYWGELQGRWIDCDLIEAIAQQRPNWQVNLIGPDKYVEKRIQLPNVHYLGEKPVSELYQYGAFSDAGLIPFKQGAVSDSVNPIKAYEYLACNLPIVSIPMPELDAFPCSFQVPGDAARFVEMIECLPVLSEVEQKRIWHFLEKSTWAGRAIRFLQLMNGTPHATKFTRSA